MTSEAEALSTSVASRPVLFNGDMVRAILSGTKTLTRRPIVVRTSSTSIGRKMLTDLSRSHVDPGFPTDDEGNVLPMARWSSQTDPPSPFAYRYQYLKVPFAHPSDGWEVDPENDRSERVYCPFGAPGDRLWVKETFALRQDVDPKRELSKALHYIHYRAGYSGDLGMEWHHYGKWKPSIHMPRWASRITLEIVSVRPERLQSITEADAIAEGVAEYAGANQLHGYYVTAFSHLWDDIYGSDPALRWDASPWVWRVEFRRIASP